MKQNVFSTGSFGVGDGKNKTEKNQVRNEEQKKVVVPNATMQIPPNRRHLVEVQVLGKVDHRNNGRMEIRKNRERRGQIFQKKWH